MFIVLRQNRKEMNTLGKSFLLAVIISGIFVSAFQISSVKAGIVGDCDVDTARIAVVELTVLGMDSITVDDVQDKLDETCGVSFNFACWNDTVVFIEYDSVLTDKFQLMAVINDMGYIPSIRLEY